MSHTPAEEPLPPRPEAGDCCNGGCAVCVLEGYDEEVAAWEKQCAEILQRRAAATAVSAPASPRTPDA